MVTQTRINLRQEKFAMGMVLHGVAYTAAVEAGFTKNTATRASATLLKNKFVINEIVRLKKQMRDNFMIDAEWAANKLKKVADTFIPDEAMTLDHQEAAVGVKAVGEINKMFGHYAPVKTKLSNDSEDGEDGFVITMNIPRDDSSAS